VLRVALAVVVSLIVGRVGTASADAPSGYKCGKGGKRIAGKGCTCPKGKVAARDKANVAVCVAKKAKAKRAKKPKKTEELAGVVQLALGSRHACALVKSGRVFCWGYNVEGQLGDGTKKERHTAVEVAPLPDMVEIAAGGDNTCARAADDRVYCWGFMAGGAEAVEVIGLADVVQLGVGTGHACARASTGRVLCWGTNYESQLGDGTRSARDAPVEVKGITDAVDLGVGASHSCVRTGAGRMSCWGANGDGQLGDRTTTNRSVAVESPDVTDIVSIGVGELATCAVQRDGMWGCWGAVPGDTAPSDVELVDVHPQQNNVCARTANHEVVCWGVRLNGASGLSGVEQVATGDRGGVGYACARMSDGTVACWGANDWGQLGDGTTKERAKPVTVKR